MNTNFVIGSFYTRDTPYEAAIKEYLLKSLSKYPDIGTIIKVIDNLGNWRKNVAQKPKIILEMLNKAFTPLVFLDADATVEQYPKLFDKIPLTYDIAYHKLSWKTWYGYKDSKVTELLTGTMWFNPNDKVKALCQDWYNEAITNNEWEQKSLARILSKRKDIKVYPLPIEYCFMNSRPENQPPLISDKNVVIRHYQCSRDFKRIIKTL